MTDRKNTRPLVDREGQQSKRAKLALDSPPYEFVSGEFIETVKIWVKRETHVTTEYLHRLLSEKETQCGLHDDGEGYILSIDDGGDRIRFHMAADMRDYMRDGGTWWALNILCYYAHPHSDRRIRIFVLPTTCFLNATSTDDTIEATLQVNVKVSRWKLLNGYTCIHNTFRHSRVGPILNPSFVLLSRIGDGDRPGAAKAKNLEDMYKYHGRLQLDCKDIEFKSKDTGGSSLFLQKLPNEVLLKILSWLFASSLRAVSQTCRRLRGVVYLVALDIVPGLKLRQLSSGTPGGLLPHQKQSLLWMLKRELKLTHDASHLDPRVIKLVGESGRPVFIDRTNGIVTFIEPDRLSSGAGGCLCDAPGLGKTVTCIALILWTLGKRSKPISEAAIQAEKDTIAAEIWEQRNSRTDRWSDVNQYSSQFIHIIEDIMTCDCDLSALISYKYLVPQNRRDKFTVENKFCSRPKFADALKLIESKYELCAETVCGLRHRYNELTTITLFNDGLNRILDFWISVSEIRDGADVAQILGDEASQFWNEVRMVGFMCKTVLKPKITPFVKSILANLTDRKSVPKSWDNRLEKTVNLLPSGATLIVVPDHMVSHWKNQILQCVLPTSQDIDGARTVWEETFNKDFTESWGVTRRSSYFDTDRHLSLPDVETLAESWVVVISALRFAQRHKCPALFQIKWLRLVVDEGDTLGNGGQASNSNINLNYVAAESKWIVSGTPTPIKAGDSGLGRLRNLLQFIGEAPFDHTNDPEGKLFQKLLRGPFDGLKRLDAATRLESLISNCMIKHHKEDINAIKKPIVSVEMIELTQQERDAYNVVAAQMQHNLLLNEMCVIHDLNTGLYLTRDEDPNWQNSWANPKNFRVKSYSGDWTGAESVFKKLCQLCCGNEKVVISVNAHDRIETMKFLRIGYDEPTYELKHYHNINNMSRQINEAIGTLKRDTSSHGVLVGSKVMKDFKAYVGRTENLNSSHKFSEHVDQNAEFYVMPVLKENSKNRAFCDSCGCCPDLAVTIVECGHVFCVQCRKVQKSRICPFPGCVHKVLVKMDAHVCLDWPQPLFTIEGSAEASINTWLARDSKSTCFEPGCQQKALNGFGVCCKHRLLNTHLHNSPAEKAERWLTKATSTLETTPCDSCGIKITALLTLECGHLACPQCLNPTSRACPVQTCSHPIMVDWFTLMQPGFNLRYSRDEHCPICKVDFAMFPKRKFKGVDTIDRNECSEAQQNMLDKHKDCQFWLSDSEGTNAKANFIISKITKLQSQSRKPWKAVIFSQFPNQIMYLGDKLIRWFGVEAMKCGRSRGLSGEQLRKWAEEVPYRQVADTSLNKSSELERFCTDPECKILLLLPHSLKGPDLSFVTHLFTLDEVLDLAVWDQLIARAYRLGSLHSVRVYKLVARGTIEEQLLRENEALARAKGREIVLTTETDTSLTGVNSVLVTHEDARKYRERVLRLLPKIRLVRPLNESNESSAKNDSSNPYDSIQWSPIL